MAKVKIKVNGRKLEAQIIKEIEKVINSNDLKRDVGIFATERIRYQARTTKPLNDTKSFPALKKLTKSSRERLKKFNKTHRTFAVDRANITLTGQFLNSLGFNIIKGGIELLYKGTRRPYKTGPNSSAKKTPTNDQLAGYLRKLGFRAFSKRGLENDKKFNKQINSIVRRFLRRSLRKK